MKKPFTLICGTIALLCLFSMFVPVIVPRYPAQLYHPAMDYTREYIYTGDYYYAREYWSIIHFMLAQHSNVLRLTLAASMSMLLYWSTLSFMGDVAIKTGLIASIVNLGVTIFYLTQMIAVAGACRWPVVIVILIDTLAAVAAAILHRRWQ